MPGIRRRMRGGGMNTVKKTGFKKGGVKNTVKKTGVKKAKSKLAKMSAKRRKRSKG